MKEGQFTACHYWLTNETAIHRQALLNLGIVLKYSRSNWPELVCNILAYSVLGELNYSFSLLIGEDYFVVDFVSVVVDLVDAADIELEGKLLDAGRLLSVQHGSSGHCCWNASDWGCQLQEGGFDSAGRNREVYSWVLEEEDSEAICSETGVNSLRIVDLIERVMPRIRTCSDFPENIDGSFSQRDNSRISDQNLPDMLILVNIVAVPSECKRKGIRIQQKRHYFSLFCEVEQPSDWIVLKLLEERICDESQYRYGPSRQYSKQMQSALIIQHNHKIRVNLHGFYVESADAEEGLIQYACDLHGFLAPKPHLKVTVCCSEYSSQQHPISQLHPHYCYLLHEKGSHRDCPIRVRRVQLPYCVQQHSRVILHRVIAVYSGREVSIVDDTDIEVRTISDIFLWQVDDSRLRSCRLVQIEGKCALNELRISQSLHIKHHTAIVSTPCHKKYRLAMTFPIACAPTAEH